MNKIQFLDRYPVFVEEIAKADLDDPVEAPNQVIAGWVEALREG